jgi:K+ transporter
MVVLGADRPSEGGSSAWMPFHSRHGVSAHAFIGGVPFMTAANMAGNVYVKAALYGMSTLTGLSRINDDQHYLSQAALGWYIAYLSSRVVEKGDDPRQGRLHFSASSIPGGWLVTARKIF